jgi:hypothetical protein
MQLSLFKIEEPTVEIAEGEKCYTCVKCKQEKPASEYSPYAVALLESRDGPRKPDGYHVDNANRGVKRFRGGGNAVTCKSCMREYSKGKRVALKNSTPKPVVDTACECCGKITKPYDLQFDHCHETHVFRGWICRSCNMGIGGCGDNVEGLERAIRYLKKNER